MSDSGRKEIYIAATVFVVIIGNRSQFICSLFMKSKINFSYPFCVKSDRTVLRLV